MARRCVSTGAKPDEQHPCAINASRLKCVALFDIATARGRNLGVAAVGKEHTDHSRSEGDNQMDHNQIVTALGRAVAARWGDLPTSIQRDLFEAAIRVGAAGETLAVYLHHQHPRTIDGEHVARETPEPDSLGG
jgi:hypothetical protein